LAEPFSLLAFTWQETGTSFLKPLTLMGEAGAETLNTPPHDPQTSESENPEAGSMAIGISSPGVTFTAPEGVTVPPAEWMTLTV
jgi:hypothetical protein